MADETEKIEAAADDAAEAVAEEAGKAKKTLREIAEAVEAEAAERKAAAEEAVEAEAEPAAVEEKAAEVVEEAAKPEKTTRRRSTAKKAADGDAEDKPKTKRAPRKKPAKKSVGAKADTATRGKVAEEAAELEPALDEVVEEERPKSKSVKAREAKAEAKAAKDAVLAENASQSYAADAPRKGTSWPIAIALALLGAALGVLIGHFVLPGGSGTPGIPVDNSSLSADGLDSSIGIYNYKGEDIAITAREVLESTTGVDAALNDDGTYDMPAADDVLSFARNAILNKEVEAAGIEVTDADISAYMTEVMGTEDISAVATQYGLDEESARKIIAESAGVRMLYQQVTAEAGQGVAMPEAPAAPAEDADQSAPTAEYAAYIIGLLGDEWNVDANTWAREDGPYYAQMGGMEFNSDGATYDQAQTAYYVAYTNYATQATMAQQLWTDYVNGLLSGASISIASLAS